MADPPLMLECKGCGEDVSDADAARVWMTTPLGYCCAKTHVGACEAEAVRRCREQPARRRDPPDTDAKRT